MNEDIFLFEIFGLRFYRSTYWMIDKTDWYLALGFIQIEWD